jgi:tetraacyldisaccharide 4'-kinase
MTANTRVQGGWLWSLNPVSIMLWPLSLIFCVLVKIRFQLYRYKFIRSEKVNVPVIVVGNISLGGNGKTPFVHSLLKLLRSRGYHPGILTRGYKSDHEHMTTLLSDAKTSNRAGDEANMLSELCHCPIAVGADRVKSARQLIEQFPALDCLIMDDGLQHYALARDVEIIVQRAQAYGNGFCLPAGPLRESRSRLQTVDLVVDRDGAGIAEEFGLCWNLLQPQKTCNVSDFAGERVHALAGIGFPQFFFDGLERQGLDITAHAFADHESFSADDIIPYQDAPLLVTHKDAVKLKAFATANIWVVPLELILSDALQYRLITLIESKFHG